MHRVLVAHPCNLSYSGVKTTVPPKAKTKTSIRMNTKQEKIKR
jgi:hypothetical protein